MESGSKTAMDAATIIKALNRSGVETMDERFPVRELSEGSFNSAYLVRLSSGNEAVMKIAPADNTTIMTYEEGIMKTETSVMALVKEYTEVPVPSVILYDESHEVIKSDFFLMEKCSGVSFSSVRDGMSKEDADRIYRSAGYYNRLINSIGGDYFGYPSEEGAKSDSLYGLMLIIFRSLLSDAMRIGCDIGVAPEEIMREVERRESIFAEVTKPVLVHWDLWEGNIFVEKGEISGIIDFERALFGDPLLEYLFYNIHEGENNEPFLQGYGRTVFTSSEVERRAVYNLMLRLIQTVECRYRRYSGDSYEPWARGELHAILKDLQSR